MDIDTIYIVSTDCEGDISYWTDPIAANEELWRIIDEVYDGDENAEDDLVRIREVAVNESWL